MTTLPKTIQEVLDQLDQVIELETQRQSVNAYFPCLYRAVTAKVQAGIQSCLFDDVERMEKFDVVFANRYLAAYYNFQADLPTTLSWKNAFEAGRQNNLLILQYLLIGMNTHIDLDLGIAAATIAPEDQLFDLENDFNRINDILFDLVDDVQDRLSTVSPLLGLLDKFAGGDDEKIAKFGLGETRNHAWRLACLLAPLPMVAWPPIIETTDKGVDLIGRVITRPRTRIARGLVKLIKRFESKDVLKNIGVLK